MSDEVMLEAKHVSKEFGKGDIRVTAVSDVSIRVKGGELVLILGPSGSGKTTLLSMLGCILTPTVGEILVEGRKVFGMSTVELGRTRKDALGFVFQSFNLLKSLTALENVEVALNLKGVKGDAAKKKAREILDYVGLGKRLDFYPADLSGGEKQRVSIARALVKDPRIILADEPTGNLDSKTGQRIGELLRDIAKKKGAAVVVVTHDSRIEGFADRILHLEDGRITRELIK